MKDYQKVADKIRKMATFCDIHQCGWPSEHFQVNLCCQLCEAYVIGYTFYVAYSWGKWSIDYTLDNSITMRADMQSIRGIKTDKEMYAKVQEVIDEIRKHCGVAA